MTERPVSTSRKRRRLGFGEDFRRFFLRGLAALLPTLITLSVLIWAWDFLWENLGRQIILVIRWTWYQLSQQGILPYRPSGQIRMALSSDDFGTRVLGVALAILLVYIVGLLVGNLIGRTVWKLGEVLVMKVPVVRAIYPAVKQVTDFVLSDRKAQFESSRVVAVQPHENGIWSIGLITGAGLKPLSESVGQEMVSVFLPNTPAAFSGYMLVVPRDAVVDLPLTVEEAMRLLVSGGVIVPDGKKPDVARSFRDAVARPNLNAMLPKEPNEAISDS